MEITTAHTSTHDAPAQVPTTSLGGSLDRPAHTTATRLLLLLSALAGPLYCLIGATQYAFRDGLDITRHALSMATLSLPRW